MITRASIKKTVKFLLIIILLLIAIYMGRGFIRVSLARGYANLVYMPAVNKTFDNNFAPVNDRLQTYIATDLKEFQRSSCGGASFHGLQETVPCSKEKYSQLNVSSATITKWHQESPALEQYLLSTGWNKTYDATQPIASLFDQPPGNYSLAVNYNKLQGKTLCSLSISYSRYVTRDAPQISKIGAFVDESCRRGVSFFGGYWYGGKFE